MGSSSDRNKNYMREMWGTSELITDYNNNLDKKLLQEVNYENTNIINEKRCKCKGQFDTSFLSE